VAVEPDEEKVPWYKRELGGGKKKGAGAPAESKAPFWKRGKKSDVDVEVAAATVAAVVGGAGVQRGAPPPLPDFPDTPAKAPFWKLDRGGSKRNNKGAPAESVRPEIVLAADPAPPWWSRLTREVGGDKSDKRLKTVIGLKIGGSQIAAARVENVGHPELVQLARERLERGVVVAGELRDPDALARALSAFFKKHHLPKRNVRLGIANNRVNVRILDIAGAAMSPKQLENAIRFRAQEALPIAIDDAVLDYQVLSQSVSAEGEFVHRILLVVAYRDLIDRYVEACQKAGIRLVGIDLEAFALLRAMAEPPPPSGRSDAAQVVVAVGHDRSTFAVSDGVICEFTRVLDWGGQTLDIAIARQLNTTPSEAEPIKWGVALDNSERPLPEGVSADAVTQATEVVRRQLQTFARELVSSLQFYQNQPGSLGIGEIVITGGTAQMPGLAAELQRLIGVVVRVGDPVGRLAVARRVRNLADAGSLAIAIGLGIEA
jgi:type IV pilus assembly protein PilM